MFMTGNLINVNVVKYLNEKMHCKESRKTMLLVPLEKGINMIKDLQRVIRLCLNFKGPISKDLKLGSESLEEVLDYYDKLLEEKYYVMFRYSRCNRFREDNIIPYEQKEVRKLQEKQKSLDDGDEISSSS